VRGIIKDMAKYPIFLEVSGRRVVLIGGGAIAARKAEPLLKAGARLVVVAERTGEAMRELCRGTTAGSTGSTSSPQVSSPQAEMIEGRYSKDYLSGAMLAIAATDDDKLNQRIYKDCQELEILCNVVDSPVLCDFFVPAVVKRGDLQIAICTEGHSPAYAGHIRKKIEKIFTEKHGEFLAELEAIREHIIEEVTDPAERKALSGKLVDDTSFEYFVANGVALWRRRAEEMIKSHTGKQ